MPLGLVLLLLAGAQLSAATFTWIKNSGGNASGSWAAQANWSGGTLPSTTNDTAAFNTLDMTVDSSVTLDGSQTVNALSFSDTATGSAASWIINAGTPSGSALTLGGSIPAISVSGLASGKAAALNAVVAGTNGFSKNGTSYLQLNAANLYSGNTILTGSDCRVSVGHDRAFGTGKILVGANPGDGEVWFQPAGTRTLTNDFEIRTIRWIIDWNTANGVAAGDLTVSGNVMLNAGGSNVRDIFCGKNLTLNGNLTVTPASNPFNKQGGSTLTLNGTNTFSGPTTINAGTLIVNGAITSSGTVTVNSGTTLSGTGVIGGTVSLQDGGTLLVGNGGSGPTTVGGCTATANAKFIFSLGATNNAANGFLKINGNLTLGGQIQLSDLGGFSSGVYTGMWYSGTLLNNNLAVSGAPAGKTVVVDTTTPHYVLFRVLAGQLAPAAGDAVPMDLASPVALSWVEVVSATTYDVFLGTSSNAVFSATTNTSGIYQGRTANLTNAVSGLLPNTTYYWRVDGVNASGAATKGVVFSFTTGSPMTDLMQDTWVATDALSRTLPGHAECGPLRSDRLIGIFYFLWHTTNSLGSDGPRDNTKEIQRLGGYTDPHNPWADNPLWMSGGNARSWYWGEPEAGYYGNDDEWVIRRHVALLEAAGVDVLGFDTTNGHPETQAPKYLKVLEVIRKMRLEGTPVHLKVFCYTHATSPATVTWLYENFYRPGLYRDLWFLWQGKPLIIGYPDGLSAGDGSVSTEVRNYFNWRTGWAYVSGSLANEWQWIDVPTPPNFGWNGRNDIPEQLPVTCGGWANGNLGRSQFNNAQPAYDNFHLSAGRTEGQGLLFREQAFYGLKYDPQFLWIVGWNEWWAGAWDASTYCYTHLLGDCVPAGKRYFVDNYNAEYSRDIEPVKGGFTDNYFYQMVGYNRFRKGARLVPAASAAKTINLAGDFSDWADVGPEFRDYSSDTLPRNHPSTFSNLPNYTDSTGRNDFTLLKVARDADYLYFLAQCSSNLTRFTDTNWLVLFLNTDQNHATGWEGYDFAVNLGSRTASTTSLSRNTTTTNGWTWTTLRSDLAWKAVGNQFMVRVPRASLGLTNEPLALDFHWADNFQTNDVTGFFLYGDSAPDRRFNYRYQVSAGTPVTLRQDSFDAGKQSWWDESWTNGSKWNLTSTGSYSGSAAQCSTANGTSQSALVTRVDTSTLESLRLSFRYKLTNVLDAQNFNVQFLTATGWVTLRDLGRDEFHPTGQSWSYDEKQNVWMTFADARAKSGSNAVFFHQNFALRLDGTGISSRGQAAWIDDFLLTGVIAPTNNPPPAPWQMGDLGTNGISGDTVWTNGVFAVTGSGADIWNTADGFRFVWQPRVGDGALTARITSQIPSDIWAKAGVMIRETIAAGARHAAMVLTPGNGLSFQRRVAAGGLSDNTTVAGSFGPPYWVRLVRSGTAFSGFASPDGTNWTQIGTTNIPGFPTNALWGLAVTAHNDARTSTATFDQVAFSSTLTFPPIPNQTVIAGQTLVVTNTVGGSDAAQNLIFTALAAPANSTVDPATGTFTWRPALAQSPLVTSVKLKAQDIGPPSQSATQSFWITVNRPVRPRLAGAAWTNGAFGLRVSGDYGPDYTIQGTSRLDQSNIWASLLTTNSPTMPFWWIDPLTNLPQRYYRVLLGP